MAAIAIPRTAMAATTSETPFKQPPEKSLGLKKWALLRSYVACQAKDFLESAGL
jgi:hypothetical protein